MWSPSIQLRVATKFIVGAEKLQKLLEQNEWKKSRFPFSFSFYFIVFQHLNRECLLLLLLRLLSVDFYPGSKFMTSIIFFSLHFLNIHSLLLSLSPFSPSLSRPFAHSLARRKSIRYSCLGVWPSVCVCCNTCIEIEWYLVRSALTYMNCEREIIIQHWCVLCIPTSGRFCHYSRNFISLDSFVWSTVQSTDDGYSYRAPYWWVCVCAWRVHASERVGASKRILLLLKHFWVWLWLWLVEKYRYILRIAVSSLSFSSLSFG